MSDILKKSVKNVIKKEYLKSKLKSIIAENVKVLIETKMKVIRSKFEELLLQKKITEKEYKMLFREDGSPAGPFKHKIFAEMVYQTIMADENHTLHELVSSFPMFKNKIINTYNRKQLKNPGIPGTSRDTFPILELVQKEILTFDKYNEYLNILNQTDARTEILQKVLDEGFQGKKDHFEIIHEDNNWIVVYPKTYLGSIATARMGPDKKYYTPPDVIGKMSWCTSVDSGNNMFLNYHRRLNLHMYYFTRKHGFSPDDKNRKLCISISKKGKILKIAFGGATVNGDNKSFKEPEEVERLLDEKVYNKIFRDAQRPDRQEIDEKEFYKSVSASQYQTIRNAADENDVNIELFSNEIKYYITYNKNPEVLDLIFTDTNQFIMQSAAYYYSEVDDPSGKYIKSILDNTLYSKEIKKPVFINIIITLLQQPKANLLITNNKIKEILNHPYADYRLINGLFHLSKNIENDDIEKYVFKGTMQDSQKQTVLQRILRNNNNIDPDMLLRITKSKYIGDYSYQYVLNNGSVTEDIIKYLCLNPPRVTTTLDELVRHKKMTQENFNLLWRNWSYNTYKKLSPRLTNKIKERISVYVPFFLAVTSSPFITEDIIYDIIEKKCLESDALFLNLAGNKSISENITRRVINFAVAENNHFVISKVSKNTKHEKYIRFLYEEYLKRFKNASNRSIFREEENPILFGLLENPKTPQVILRSIVAKKDPYYNLKSRLAKNPSAPPVFLARCLKDYKKDKLAAAAAAKNTSTPLLSLLKFAKKDYSTASTNAFFTAVKSQGLSIKDYPNYEYLPKLCADLGIDYEKL
jgi:hypothetical protein